MSRCSRFARSLPCAPLSCLFPGLRCPVPEKTKTITSFIVWNIIPQSPTESRLYRGEVPSLIFSISFQNASLRRTAICRRIMPLPFSRSRSMRGAPYGSTFIRGCAAGGWWCAPLTFSRFNSLNHARPNSCPYTAVCGHGRYKSLELQANLNLKTSSVWFCFQRTF